MRSVIILLFMAGGLFLATTVIMVRAFGQNVADDPQAPPTFAEETPPLNNPETEKDIEQEKKELRLMLLAAIIVLSLFFLGAILITLLRIGRRYRRRLQLDKPDGPTEYVDAWSQYRLKEDDQTKEQ